MAHDSRVGPLRRTETPAVGFPFVPHPASCILHHHSIGFLEHLKPQSLRSCPPATIRPPLFTSEPCPTLNKGRGPITLILQTSHTICTSRRSSISRGLLSALSSMVRAGCLHLRVCLTEPNRFIRFVLGVLIVLFFQCIAVLFDPANRRGEAIKWGLISYTVAMFSFATVLTGMQFKI